MSSLCVWHHGTVLMVKRANVACRKKLKGCGICSYGLLARHDKIFAGAAMVCLLDMIKFKYVCQVFKIH